MDIAVTKFASVKSTMWKREDTTGAHLIVQEETFVLEKNEEDRIHFGLELEGLEWRGNGGCGEFTINEIHKCIIAHMF